MNPLIKYIIIIFTILLYSLSGNSQSKKIKKISKEYISVAHNEIDNKYLPITKWEDIDTLKYFIKGKFKYMSNKNWKEFINEIEKITNFKIIETKNETDYDILIFFGKKAEYYDYTNNKTAKIITNNGSTYSQRKSNYEGQLIFAGFCLDVTKIKNYQKGQIYLQKFFLKSLGLRGESENDYSLYYKRFKNNGAWFNKNDRRILKIHYSEEIKVDMTIEETRLVLKNLINFKKIFKEKL